MCRQVTGDANEQQILSSLRAYSDRAPYMVEALRGFFHISKNWTERKPEVLQVKDTNIEIKLDNEAEKTQTNKEMSTKYLCTPFLWFVSSRPRYQA